MSRIPEAPIEERLVAKLIELSDSLGIHPSESIAVIRLMNSITPQIRLLSGGDQAKFLKLGELAASLLIAGIETGKSDD